MNSIERLFAWLGGALFVASLAFCAYLYFFRWAGTDLRGGWHAAGIDALLLVVFSAHHSVFAREGVKRRLAQVIPERLLRSIYVWVAALLLIATCALWQPIGGAVFATHGVRTVLHVVVQLIGVWFIAKAVGTIDPLDLAGIRQVRLEPDTTGTADRQKPAATGLQVTGPYRVVRHPLYFGWMLVVFGAARMTGDRFAFAILTTIYLVIAIPWEERSLIAAFGGEYERYKQAVKWRMVPYVY